MAEPAEGGPPRLDFPAPGRATITLARPAQLNRLHRADLLALQAHCARLAAEPGLRAVVLRAEGRLFCAGFNLAELGSGGTAAADDPQLFERTVDALAALPVPTLARLHGGVHGGAVDLALACDFRVGEVGLQLLDAPFLDALVDMDHHRAAAFGPVTGGIGGAVQRGVAEHHEAQRAVGRLLCDEIGAPVGHAQFPLDISPRISNWRQLMYFSDHLHHRSGCAFSPSR